jgi:ABC-type sugar transport system substrate-binding protein
MTFSLRRTASALVVLVAIAAGLAVISEPASAAPEEKVTICHRTNSRTNPYNQQAVAKSSAVEGHASHDGPIFGPDVDNWGDIIPPSRPASRTA